MLPGEGRARPAEGGQQGGGREGGRHGRSEPRRSPPSSPPSSPAAPGEEGGPQPLGLATAPARAYTLVQLSDSSTNRETPQTLQKT